MEKTGMLQGNHIRLEPLENQHADGLVLAAASNRSLYKWSPVPEGIEEVIKYIQTAMDLREAGKAEPFAIVRETDGLVIGSTRFWNMERWSWRPGAPKYGSEYPDTCEIGYTWLSSSAIRTPVNTEAKLLLLKLAFEKWQTYSVCLHADARNNRSRAAIERIGAKFEGILRSHRMAVDNIPRDSARYAIVASEWPAVKMHLEKLLERK
jgi:N-acetyltransferase